MSALPSVARDVRPLGAGAVAGWLDGGRRFLQHGPINLVVHADGEAGAVSRAYRDLEAAFPAWLGRLVDELPRLRTPEEAALALPEGPIARRMAAAVRGFAADFVTPMAAVAGAVADHALAHIVSRPGIRRAFVNNGGDIAVHLSPGERLDVGVVPSLAAAIARARIGIDHASPVRGIATSGWPGRSMSLGIANAVTVLGPDAATADVAATLVANAVDAEHPAIVRTPARELDDTTDLGDRPVTVEVPALDAATLDRALDRGTRYARTLGEAGLVDSALLVAQGRFRLVGAPPLLGGRRR